MLEAGEIRMLTFSGKIRTYFGYQAKQRGEGIPPYRCVCGTDWELMESQENWWETDKHRIGR